MVAAEEAIVPQTDVGLVRMQPSRRRGLVLVENTSWPWFFYSYYAYASSCLVRPCLCGQGAAAGRRQSRSMTEYLLYVLGESTSPFPQVI